MRNPRDDDFFVELPEVGTFRYGRRTFGDRAAIKREYLTVAGKSAPEAVQSALLDFFGRVEADPPAGWDVVKGEVLRRIAGVDGVDGEIAGYANVIATHAVLCVNAPDGWADLAKVDILTPGHEEKVWELYGGLRQIEEGFRQGKGQTGEGAGAAT